MTMKLEALGERKFKIKLKSKAEGYAGSKVQSSVPSGCNKRKSEPEVEEQPSKKWIMDPNVKRQCRGVLDALLAHRHSHVFNCPVDPVALNIPDYFTVITHPMDLGTIKSKLTANAYHNTQEFAADVKLTFSNAMLYNPPANQVHSMAKELEALFLKRWKLLEAKWNHRIVSAPRANGDQRIGLDAGKNYLMNSVPLGLAVRASKPRMSVDEKTKLKKDLTEILVGSMDEKLKIEFRKLGIDVPRKEIIDREFDRFDEDVLWQLKKVVKDYGCKILSTNGNKSTQNPCGALDVKSKSSLSNHGATAKSVASNAEVDLKKALSAARAAMMKRQSAANVNCDSGKPHPEMGQLEAKAAHPEKVLADNRLKIVARRIEERKALADLEEASKRIADEDKVGSYNELLKQSGCSVSYDSHYGVVLRPRELKTGKVVDPLACIGLHLKKDFIADVTDYDDYVSDVEMEEGEMEGRY